VTTGDRALARLRRLCLALPETSETASWGHPNFRVGKRTFAAFEWFDGRPSIAVRLTAAEVDALLRHDDGMFSTPYGRGTWVSVWADGTLDWRLVSELVDRAYRTVALKRMIAALEGRRSKAVR